MAGPTTASRTPSTYVGSGVSNVEHWINGRMTSDLIFTPAPILQIIDTACRVNKELPRHHALRWNAQTAAGFTAFDGYDTLVPVDNKGPGAGYFQVRNYAMPLMSALTQEWDRTASGTTIMDWMEQRLDQIALSFRENLEMDIHKGSVVDSKRINGIEQFLYAKTASGNVAVASNTEYALLATTPRNWRVKQANNSIGGITREAWTSENVNAAGTGYENVSLHMGDRDVASSVNVIGFTSTGAPTSGMKAFHQAYEFACVGSSKPNVALLAPQLHTDIEMASMAKQFIQREVMNVKNVDLGIANISWRGCALIKDPLGTQQNTSYGDAAVGVDRVNFLNLATWKWFVDPRASFKLLKPRPSRDSLSTAAWIVLRCLFVCENPRLNSVAFQSPT